MRLLCTRSGGSARTGALVLVAAFACAGESARAESGAPRLATGEAGAHATREPAPEPAAGEDEARSTREPAPEPAAGEDGASDRDAAQAPAGDPDLAGDDAPAADDESESDEPLGSEEPRPALPPPTVDLPPVEPDPEVAPVIGDTAEPVPPARPVPEADRPAVVIKTILGLLALFGLAYLAGHPRVRAWEDKLGVTQVITAGFPFVLAGVVARQPWVGVLTDPVLAQLSPVLRLGLGWIGFVVGFRFDARLFAGVSSQVARLVTLTTALPFAAVVGASAALLILTGESSLGELVRDPVALRDGLILGTAAAMTAETAIRPLASSYSARLLLRVIRLEELAGIVGLAIVGAYFRPAEAEAAWQLPGMGWLFLTIGIGASVGAIIYGVLQRTVRTAELSVLILGSIALIAGIGGYLGLSSVVLAFVAGIIVTNLPGGFKQQLAEALYAFERPIYFVSLVAIGAVWRIDDWRGWALVPVFLGARMSGRLLGVRLSEGARSLGLRRADEYLLVVAPLGPLAIATVVSAQLLYPGGSVSHIVAAIIGSSIVTEIVVQLFGRRFQMSRAAPARLPQEGA